MHSEILYNYLLLLSWFRQWQRMSGGRTTTTTRQLHQDICHKLLQVFFLQKLDLLKLSISKLSSHAVTFMFKQHSLLPAFKPGANHGSKIIKSLSYHDPCIINTTAVVKMLFSHRFLFHDTEHSPKIFSYVFYSFICFAHLLPIGCSTLAPMLCLLEAFLTSILM